MEILDPYGRLNIPLHSQNIRNRRGPAIDWMTTNYVLDSGELGFEEDTGRFKLGDGEHGWNDLDYYIPRDEIVEMIDIAVFNGGGPAALNEHVNSETPHPVYDDGPSLFLLYQNAKV